MAEKSISKDMRDETVAPASCLPLPRDGINPILDLHSSSY